MWQNLVLLFSLNSLFSNFAPNPVSHSCDSPPDKESSFSSLIYGQVHCSTIPSRPHAIKRWTLDTRKTICTRTEQLFARGGMSGWNEGGRSDKENEEKKKKKMECVTGILNCKGLHAHQMVNFSRPRLQLEQIRVTTTSESEGLVCFRADKSC